MLTKTLTIFIPTQHRINPIIIQIHTYDLYEKIDFLTISQSWKQAQHVAFKFQTTLLIELDIRVQTHRIFSSNYDIQKEVA